MQLINIQSLEGFFFLGYIKISVAYMYVNLYQQQYSSRSYPYTKYCKCGCSWGCKHQLQQVIQLIHVQDQCLLLLITVC